MNLKDTILSEISQAQKDKYCMISLTDTCEIENNQTCRSREYRPVEGVMRKFGSRVQNFSYSRQLINVQKHDSG